MSGIASDRFGRRALADLRRDRRGSIAVITALLAPVLLLLVAGVVDVTSLRGDWTQMQDVSDAAALNGAKTLGLTSAAGIAAQARQFSQTELVDVATRIPFTVSTSISSDGSQVTVAIDGHRPSIFGSLLPPGGWSVHAQSTAAALAKVPLCVLATNPGSSNVVQLGGTSQMTAGACLVQSDNDVSVTSGAFLKAAVVQSVGAASGNISPAPQVGAPAIADPFASMSITTPLPLCSLLDIITYTTGNTILAPGVHCGNIKVQNGATLTLLPGEHYFLSGGLDMLGSSTLTGSDVVLIFDDKSKFTFEQNSSIDLSGRQSGAFAGFVIATTRTNTNPFTISSTSAHKLLGTVYIPSAVLDVTGTGNQVADQSAWTVIVAKSINLTGSANLVINSNYAGTAVPIPVGVGSAGPTKVRLSG